jgi:hypothetical protein
LVLTLLASEIACYGYTQCVFHTADVNYPAMVGCCDNAYSQQCLFETTCYDAARIAATPTLTESPANEFAIFCTKSTAASCIQWTYPELSITDFGCSSIHTTQTLYLTAHPYSNNVPVSSSLSYVGGIPTVASVIGSLVNDNFISDYFHMAAATGSVNRNVPSSTGVGSSTAASGSSTGSAAATPAHHSSNTAAIAGGVVGGVVGLAGIGAAIFMFILMKKKKQAQQPAYEPAPTDGSVLSSTPPPPPPPPPMSESLPSPSEVSGSSFHKYAAVDAYQADMKYQSGPIPQEMDARSFVAELPAPAHDTRPLSYVETPISYTSGHRYGS